MSVDANISRTITLCRFPLIAVVVMLHSGAVYSVVFFGGGDFAHFFSEIFTRVAVPLFFCISGYLLFNNFSIRAYPQKIKKRIKTLLVPYLFWNLVFIATFGFLQYLSLANVDRKPIAEWSANDFLWSFWDVRHIQGYESDSGGSPFHSHLWFLRDLFMMALCSPLFYYLLKSLRSIVVIVAFTGWFFLPFDLFYFMKNESIFFFVLGGYLQLYSYNVLNSYSTKRTKPIWGVATISILSLVLFVMLDNMMWGHYLKKVYILSGCFVFFVLMSFIRNERTCRILSELSDSTFFVYGCHGLIVAVLSKLLLSYISGNAFIVSLSFVLTWIIAIVVSLLLYYLVKRFMPLVLYLAGGKAGR